MQQAVSHHISTHSIITVQTFSNKDEAVFNHLMISKKKERYIQAGKAAIDIKVRKATEKKRADILS